MGGGLTSKRKTIFVFKDRALGDAVLTLSSLGFLRRTFPNARILFGTPAWTLPLFPRKHRDYDELYPLPDGPLKSLRLFQFLMRNQVSMIFECHARPSWSRSLRLFSKLSAVPYWFHHHGDRRPAGLVLDQGVRKPIIQRDLDGIWSGLKHWGYKVQIPRYLDYRPEILRAKGSQKDRSLKIVLGVVATRETKKWPLESFLRLSLSIKEQFPFAKFLVPLSPSAEDQKIASRMKLMRFPECVQPITLPLDQLRDKIWNCDLYIGNDTGLKHISVALGLKSITFFGPEEPFEWHPYSIEEHPFLFINPLECRTRDAHYCGLSFCESMICMGEMKPDDCLSYVKKLNPHLT